MSDLHLLSPAKGSAALQKPSEYAAAPYPSLADWQKIWHVWDTVTLGMVPEKELLAKPIKLRNAVIFYLGHIPTFLDIHITRATRGSPTEPRSFQAIFERGIDPDVENPEQCHDHSEIPENWPALSKILEFQGRVRARIQGLYATDFPQQNVVVARALWLGFEHEAMHLETLLYMLLQGDSTSKPPGTAVPEFHRLAKEAQNESVPNTWHTVPATTIKVGLNDPEDQPEPARHFGWDNEKPQREVHVPSFFASARPITNEEYLDYVLHSDSLLPASWKVNGTDSLKTLKTRRATNDVKGAAPPTTNGHTKPQPATNGHTNGHSTTKRETYLSTITVRTAFGPIPLAYALSWPAIASYTELASCATYMGGRIPTADEARSLYHFVAHGASTDPPNRVLSKRIAAVNGHLSNEGVQETPPSHPEGAVGRAAAIGNGSSAVNSEEVYVDLAHCNIGFRNWHPTSVTGEGGRLRGHADFGGAWEWTSTVLERHEGFEPMEAYPAYTSDFFDGKHNIVLGGSWATHPRIAGRKTFVNWYQRNYPYMWAGARLVKDL